MFYSKLATTNLAVTNRATASIVASLILLGAIILGLLVFSIPGHASTTHNLLIAESLKEQGKLPQALELLHRERQSTRLKSKEHTLIMGMIANIHILQRRYNEAFLVLTDTQPLAEKSGWQFIAGDQASYLANLFQRQQNPEKALRWYRKTLTLAEKSGDQKLYLQTQINLAKQLLAMGDNQQATDIAEQLADGIARDTQQARGEILNEIGLNLAQLFADFIPMAEADQNEFQRLAFELLTQILATPEAHSERIVSQSYGLLAALYQMENRYQEAVVLLDNAIFSSQQHPDLLYKWQWELGSTYKRLGQTQQAYGALERAVKNVEAIRQDIPVDYVDGRSSFRQTLEPLYLELTDVLLKQASESSGPQQRQHYLSEARNTMELLKRSELEDYFDNRCVIDNQNEVDLSQVSGNSAAIYPIVFEDRLELLVSFAQGVEQRIEQRTVNVTSTQISQTANALASKYRSLGANWQTHSMDFYQWLVSPIKDILLGNNVDTLIYLPDGALRLVPIASLYNGKQFLIEEYSVATSPGLTLFDTTQRDKSDLNILMAGLSEPGPVVDDVSERLYAAINVATVVTLQENLNRRLAYPRERREESRPEENSADSSFRNESMSRDNLSRKTGYLRIVSKRTPDGENVVLPDDLRLISKRPGVKPSRPSYLEVQSTLKRKLRIVNKIAVSDGSGSKKEDASLRIVAKHDTHQAYLIAQNDLKNQTTPLKIISKTPVSTAANTAVSKASPDSELLAQNLVFSTLNASENFGPLRVRKRSIPKDETLLQQIKANRIVRLKQRLKLPGVDEEIANISALYDGDALLNASFGKSEFIDELLGNRYDVVHIASHGVFGDSAENSFVMTHDKLLDMHELEVLLSNEKFDKAPVELITLSACQTAEGDDRAPLGISGIALRAKVRSALGALWAVSDAATVDLMSEFYVNLQKPGITKAQALREAQLTMLKQDKYRHPFFWSAFILIGNWL